MLHAQEDEEDEEDEEDDDGGHGLPRRRASVLHHRRGFRDAGMLKHGLLRRAKRTEETRSARPLSSWVVKEKTQASAAFARCAPFGRRLREAWPLLWFEERSTVLYRLTGSFPLLLQARANSRRRP